jgi:hypothetical protein
MRKTTFLPNIQDDAINAMLSLPQGSMSYALYTKQFNDFLRRSRQNLTADVQWRLPAAQRRRARRGVRLVYLPLPPRGGRW